MVIIRNKNFIKAVKASDQSNEKIAAFADSSRTTLEKMIRGQADMQLSKMDSIADYLGFDVEVRFLKRKAQVAGA